MESEKVAILDAGSQYGKVIDRRVRELKCCCELFPLDVKASELSSYKAIIISGGPNSFEDPNAPRCDPEILNLGIPILGVCYGMQWLNVVFGGKVGRGVVREDGQIDIEVETTSKLFDGLEKKQKVLLTHGDGVTTIAPELDIIGSSEHAVSAIQHKTKPLYGVQFHPEVDLTVNGKEIFRNFLEKISGFTGAYDMENRLEKAVKEIQEHAGDKKVVVLVSGGVDSSVCCALLYKALGPKKVLGIHVDTGFMRKNEGHLVKESLEKGGFQLDVIDASEEFYNGVTEIDGKLTEKLKETISPEEKRKIIGDTFIRVITKEISRLGLGEKDYYLAQGTLRPDLIESASILASSKADVIKTHHNDTALVREKRKEGLILEPLKDYHKDEVRELGRMLGLPEALVDRHPFPGPGLAIRILCLNNPFVTPEFEELEAVLKEKYSDEKITITLLPIKSVGVQGDGRTYSYVVGLSGEADWERLFEIARDIPKRIHLINRVVYIFGKPVEQTLRSITKTHLTPDVIEQVRKADDIVNHAMREYKDGELMKTLAQMPVILAPLSFDDAGKRSIVLRPFISNDFMTGVPAIPGEHFPLQLLDEIVGGITNGVEGISRVMYDLTLKPPGTTEWE